MKSKRTHQRLLQTNCHIGIIGSGLGGLAAALAILQCDTSSSGAKKQKRKNNRSENCKDAKEACDSKSPCSSTFQGRITIYERDQHATDRKEGYGMTLTYNPSGPLAQLGILESVARKDCPSRSHYLFNEKGEVMGYYGNAFHNIAADGSDDEQQLGLRGAGQRGNLRIPRAELRSILMEKIREVDSTNGTPRVHVAWGKRLVSYVDRPAAEKLNQIHVQDNTNKLDSKTIDPSKAAERPVILHFEDGTTDEVDLLIGADGVNSVVAKQYLSTTMPSKSKQPIGNNIDPEYLGIFITIGITEHMHPLIDERGYYTLDGGHRLFIMPFAGSRLDNQSRRTMWQLSFPVADREEAVRLNKLDPAELQKEILNRCSGWHAPFPDMVKETPLDTIWGTGLLNRDPDCFIQHRQLLEHHGRLPSHVVLLGDAAHAMSPFKGQGANQALTDGPLLAKWLSQANLNAAVRGYMTEMARRSGVKVKASREAAKKLHTKYCWEWMASQDGVESGMFHGIDPKHVQILLDTLRARSIGASKGSLLDEAIRDVIKEMNLDTMNTGNVSLEELQSLQTQVLRHAASGHLEQLRDLSRRSHSVIAKAVDSDQRTCLHLAAVEGHIDVCRWLLTEVNLDAKVRDKSSKTAWDAAKDQGHDEIAHLIQSYMKRCLSPDRLDEPRGQLERDAYREIEQQLRPIRTMKQLCSLLQSNRENQNDGEQITHVLGCSVDDTDKNEHKKLLDALRGHGAVVLRSFVPREVDQLALGALALRPLHLDIPRETDLPCLQVFNKKARKQVEEIKSQISIPADSPIIVQTNFGPQLSSQSNSNASKKRKIESVPLSKLRYLNLGEWNYNWGERKYNKIPGAERFPLSFSKLAERAYEVAQKQIQDGGEFDGSSETSTFDMAICNFYHLQRPSDRLGGHKDDVESDLSSPLITISLGAPGIFLLGGETRNCKPTAILLRAGDCMVMSGKSRQYFHGLPTILEYEDNNKSVDPIAIENEAVFSELEGDTLTEGTVPLQHESNDNTPSYNELLFMKAFLTSARMNISIRQV